MSNRPIHASLNLLTCLAIDLGVCLGAAPLTDPPGVPGLVVVRSFRVVDVNGDLDGFADTNETVELFVTVRNGTGHEVSNLVARLDTRDPKIGCILDDAASVPSLAPGAMVELPTPFRLRVHGAANRTGATVVCVNPGPAGHCSNFVSGACASNPACRLTAAAEYTARLELHLAADQFVAMAREQEIVLDLDLDATVPVGATSTYVEGFESGLGGFEHVNLDENRASNALSEGRRCQYNDPDYALSNSYGVTECYLGFVAGQSPVNDWHQHDSSAPDGGRAFLGASSLHYGRHTPGDPGEDTYPLSQMDAVRSSSAIFLAPRICRDDPSATPVACNGDSDCVSVGGGPCVPATPTLSFAHQVSTVDSRLPSVAVGLAADRAIVQAALAGGTFDNLAPYENVYDVQGTDQFSNCIFDPIDDGNTEDSYFDPTDPARRFGPSSTCFPEFAFSFLGDTGEPFSASNLGHASDGPGLAGALGPGTWVESKFDLSRYRGREIQLRFLLTSIKVADVVTPDDVFNWAPTPIDDGWYIDDLRLTRTVAAVSATTDDVDNSSLPSTNDCDDDGDVDDLDNCRFIANPSQADVDGDGRGDACDNCPADANPSQTDVNINGTGDACDPCPRYAGTAEEQADPDADGLGSACDNCPLALNPGQENNDTDELGDACDNCDFWYNREQFDWNADGEGDICDLDDGVILLLPSSRTQLAWQLEEGWEAWNAYEGALDVLRMSGQYTQAPGSNPLADRHCGLSIPFAPDPGAPPSGKVAFSLVTGIAGGVEGSLGTNSAGMTRPNANPCP